MIISRDADIPPPAIEEVTLSPEEQAQFADRRRRFERNMAWFGEHALEIGEKYPGKCVCVAGGELFVGDDPASAHSAARAAHPDEYGAFFSKYISPHRGPKIYAHRRSVDPV